MNLKFLLLVIFASIPIAAMENGSPGFSNRMRHAFLSLKTLAARQILKKYNDLPYIDTLKVRLPAELITCLRLEWIKLRCLDKKFYKGYNEGGAFLEAAYWGLADTIPFLYQNGGCQYVDYIGKGGNTPLLHAVCQGHLEAARVLLNLRVRALPHIYDSLAHTPLYYAAQAKNKEMVRLLLAHGADVHVWRYGEPIPTPFQAIEEAWPARYYRDDEDRKEIIEMLKAVGNGVTYFTV